MRRCRQAFLHMPIALTATVLLCAPSGLWAQSPRFSFTRLVDDDTLSPGGRGTLGEFFEPSLDGGHVVFSATDDGGIGFYSVAADGTLTRLVDESTASPGIEDPFGWFSLRSSFDGDRVAFNALTFPEMGDTLHGMYRVANGVITTIADLNVPIPSGTGNFTKLWNPNGKPSADAGQVAFIGGGTDGQMGVYVERDANLVRVVDTNTPVPGGDANFEDFDAVAMDDGRMTFVGYPDNGGEGVYLHDFQEGSLRVVVDENTPLPDGTGNFYAIGLEEYDILDLDDRNVVFVGGEDYGTGVYRYDIGSAEITAVAQYGSLVPGTDGQMFEEYFQTVSTDHGHVAFRYGSFIRGREDSFYTPYYGVYSDLSGTLERVLGIDDVLDGNVVSTAHISSEAIDGNQIAMLVEFENGADAIYLATLVPEPTGLVLLLFGLARIVRRRGT